MKNKLMILEKAHKFCTHIYKIPKIFPEDEKFGLTSQLRRSTVSIPLNIVEGQNRSSKKDFVRFLYNARGSLEEARHCLLLCKDLEYLQQTKYQELEEEGSEISKMLNALIKSLKT
jgi:four helix bundle protein